MPAWRCMLRYYATKWNPIQLIGQPAKREKRNISERRISLKYLTDCWFQRRRKLPARKDNVDTHAKRPLWVKLSQDYIVVWSICKYAFSPKMYCENYFFSFKLTPLHPKQICLIFLLVLLNLFLMLGFCRYRKIGPRNVSKHQLRQVQYKL